MNTHTDEKTHRNLAAGLFNRTWELLDMENRSPTQDEEMVHTAHASRYHWEIVGTPLNQGRGEWLISQQDTD